MGIEAKVNYFHIENYIVGRILSLGSPMNYQSVGVKGYTSLNHAKLFNMALNANYDILTHLHWKGMVTYARATDDKGGNLPFIRPLSYQTSLYYMYRQFGIRTSMNGDLAQENYSPEYGEDLTSAYMVWNVSADYTFSFRNYKAVLQVGAKNLFNEHYSTYADWGEYTKDGA